MTGTTASTRSIFAGYHPLIGFFYFGYVILVPILFLQPVFLALSFVSALAFSIYLNKGRGARFAFGFVLPLMVICALFNPAFNHQGMTLLFYFRYNPITLEAVIYGICSAAMLGGVILWFACYNAVMTSDKFIYLFGRIIPAMSLILSMALRFIPHYKAQIKRIASARRGIGFDAGSGNMLARARNGAEILSIMVTWALENGIETSDSMRSRGYGLPGRTAYSNYRLDARDLTLFFVFAALIAVSVFAVASGAMRIVFFPMFIMESAWPFAQISWICHGVVCLLPLALEIREDILWKTSLGNITGSRRGDAPKRGFGHNNRHDMKGVL